MHSDLNSQRSSSLSKINLWFNWYMWVLVLTLALECHVKWRLLVSLGTGRMKERA